MNYQILVNKENKIDKNYLNNVIIPSLVPIVSLKNNEIVFKTFGIEDKTNYLEKETAENFKALRNYARKKNIILDITSGYLSLEQQERKYNYFLNKFGEEFTKKSACLPGYSEHNTGLALDCDIFTNGKWAGIAPDKNGDINKQTQWFHTVLHEFGFILRYPKGKEEITKMKFEPWHIRYVQKELAKFIYKNKLTLEEYFKQKNTLSSTEVR